MGADAGKSLPGKLELHMRACKGKAALVERKACCRLCCAAVLSLAQPANVCPAVTRDLLAQRAGARWTLEACVGPCFSKQRRCLPAGQDGRCQAGVC